MTEGGFPVEEFLQAITSQLDRTQDALRLKSVTRPLTYAIRDFSMELKVFVELSPDGRVMFRPSASDDTGASVVHIGFTTVNRTMIEENTVSLSSVKSPTLDELGLDEQERRQLERLGVSNVAQLDQLKATTGESTVARYSGLPVSRLRQALAAGRPVIRSVTPVTEPGPVGSGTPAPDRVRVPAGTRRLVVGGPGVGESRLRARLGGRQLSVRPVDGGAEIDLGDEIGDGELRLDLGGDDVVSMALEFEPTQVEVRADNGDRHPVDADDPWRSP